MGDGRSLDIVDDIVSVLWDLDRQSEAFALRLRVLAAVEEEIGPEHSALIRPLTSLAWYHEDEDWQPKGDPLFRRALEIAQRTFETNSLKFADVLYDYANYNFFNDRNKGADPYYRRALAIYDQDPEVDPENG